MDGVTVTLLRCDDLLVVEIAFVNVRRTEAIIGGMVLRPANPAARRRGSAGWRRPAE